jgi:hypothetical protein
MPSWRQWRVAVIVGLILLSRLLVLLVYQHQGDIDVYATYSGLASQSVTSGQSFYELHRTSIVDAATARGQPPVPGATLVEYPPLAISLMAAIGIGLPQEVSPPQATVLGEYGTRFRAVAFCVDLLVLAGFWALSRRRVPASEQTRQPRVDWYAIAVFGIAGLVLANVLYDRLDIFVGGLLFGGMVLLIRDRWPFALALLAVAVAFKAVPVVVAPVWIVASLSPTILRAVSRNAMRTLAAALVMRIGFLVGAIALIFAPIVIRDGLAAFEWVRFNSERGLQLESIPASVLLILHRAGWPEVIAYRYGAYEVVGRLSQLLATTNVLLVVGGIALVTMLYTGAARRWLNEASPSTPAPRTLAASNPGLVVLATISALMVTLSVSKVLSPQYLLWIAPVIALLPWRRWTRAIQAGFVAACALTTAIIHFLYLGQLIVQTNAPGEPGAYGDSTLLAVLALAARDSLLVVLAIAFVLMLWRNGAIPGAHHPTPTP